MTDPEINKAVKQFESSAFLAGQNIQKMLYDKINSAVALKLGKKVEDYPYGFDFYCTNIQAAWEIVEKIEYFCLTRNHTTGKWEVFDMAGIDDPERYSQADTAPMAIALAFLKLEDK